METENVPPLDNQRKVWDWECLHEDMGQSRQLKERLPGEEATERTVKM